MKFRDRFEQHLQFIRIEGAEGKARCPFHSDETESFSANLDSGLWQCFGCGASGNWNRFKEQIKSGIATQKQVKALDKKIINRQHKTLMNNDFIRNTAKKKRLWTDDILKQYKIGWNGQRVIIPIFDEYNNVVNAREYDILHQYSPNIKMKFSLSGKQGDSQIYAWPSAKINSNKVFLTEGEPDALLGLSLNMPIITFTAGASSVAKNISKYAHMFKGKKVYILYDADEAGQAASKQIANTLGKISDVYNVDFKSGDFTDYIIDNKRAKFNKLISNTAQYEVTKESTIDTNKCIDVTLNVAATPNYHNKYISFKSIVSGKDTVPFLVPKKLNIKCGANATYCRSCPLFVYGGEFEYEIPELHSLTLDLLNISTKSMLAVFKDHFGVAIRCSTFETEIVEVQNVEELRLIPDFSFTDLTSLSEYVSRQAFFCGGTIKSNAMYKFKGTTVAHPKTQYATHILNKHETVIDTVTNFKLSPDKIKALNIFKVQKDGTVKNKIKSIVEDLIYNVTQIYQREDLVKGILFTYLSVLSFKFLKKTINKGWVESLILGDTRCGKSETVQQLIKHFRLGELATGENVSYAGLVGGIQQLASRFMITWGKVPLNDRRLLVIDEASSLELEDIERLSNVRSGGIAEITKIQSEKTFARTRLLWMSNPRSARSLESYSLGITAIPELVGKPEDVARFDYVLLLAANEVDAEVINAEKHKRVKHKFKSELFNNLVLWAWSREPHQIIFNKGVEKFILDQALKFGKQYKSDIPLIDVADFRLKLARVSIAVAALVFSNVGNGNVLSVKRCHVEYACEFFKEIYSKEICGYDLYVARKTKEASIKDSPEVMSMLRGYGKDFIEFLVDTTYLRVSDIEDAAGVERADAKSFISFLVKKRAITHIQSFYIKTPPFIELLKKMSLDNTIHKEALDTSRIT